MVYGQTSPASIDRVISLSNMAEFFFMAGNYDKAIEYKKQAIDMTSVLFGVNSDEYASSVLTIANYYYSKGCSDSLNIETTNDCISNAINNLKIVMKVFDDSLLIDYDKLEPTEKYKLWQQVCPLYDRLLPCFISKCQNDSTVSELYNSVLFSKGITWQNYSDAKKRDWREIQKKLHPEDLVIEFISPVDLDEDNITFYALILNNKRSAPRMIKLFDIMQLQESWKNTKSKFEKDMEVGNLIWGNIENELQGKKNIFFSATHILHNIPIEYLPIDDKTFYCEMYNMYRLSSTAELAMDIYKSQYDTAVLYGGLDYDSGVGDGYSQTRAGLEPLFNTVIEIDEISQLLVDNGIRCEIYSGGAGTESSFKRQSGLPINIIHISTHGKYERDDGYLNKINEDTSLSRSYLALSGANKKLKNQSIDEGEDGIITALDISQMKFNALDLVCMSACESALGTYSDDDGIIGLQKGFKLAGANTILMSLDKVDDEATRILMVEFYKNLMAGKSKHQSLKDAQHYLRKVENGKYDDPKYWASFIMLDGLN